MRNLKVNLFLLTLGLVVSTTMSALPAQAASAIVDTTINATPNEWNYGYFDAPVGTQLDFTFQTSASDVGGAVDIFIQSSKTIQFHLDFTTGDPIASYTTEVAGPFEYRIGIGTDQPATQIEMTIDGATPLATRPAGFPLPPKAKSPTKPTSNSTSKPTSKPTIYQVFPSYTRRNMSAVRDGTSAQVQWFSLPGENSYVIYAGTFVPSAVNKIPDNLMKNNSNVIWLNDKSGKVVSGAVVFNPANAVYLSVSDASKGWYYSKNIKISNDINTVVLESYNSDGSKTFDFRTAVSRDGSFIGRGWKVACIVSSWGEPIANNVLKASQLSLSVIGQVTGGPEGAVANFGNSLIDEITLTTNFQNATGGKDKTTTGLKLVKGTVKMELDAQKTGSTVLKVNDPLVLSKWSKIKLKITSIKTNPLTKKITLIASGYSDASDASELYSSIVNTSAIAKANLQTCSKLN